MSRRRELPELEGDNRVGDQRLGDHFLGDPPPKGDHRARGEPVPTTTGDAARSTSLSLFSRSTSRTEFMGGMMLGLTELDGPVLVLLLTEPILLPQSPRRSL